MKSLLEGPKKKKQRYPYLGISPDGVVVLFTAPCEGVKVHGTHKRGDCYFSYAWDEENTEPLKGAITLSN